MLNHGYNTVGIDYAQKQVEHANIFLNEIDKELVKFGSFINIPYPDNTFDFVYTINVLHHLQSQEEQEKAFKEAHRVLVKGGRFIIHEMNIKNPVFRFYMSYIFPLIKNIDEGTEIWIKGVEHYLI